MIFDTAEIPAELTDEVPAESADPTCRVCGEPLTYGGRGRKPVLCDVHKRTGTTAANGGRRGSSDVEAALTTLGGMYDGLSMGLMFVSPNAAVLWNDRITSLQQQNRAILTVDKDLCRKVNNMGKGGGTFAFFAAHAMALTPVLLAMSADMKTRGATKRATRENAAPSVGPDFSVPDTMPDNFFA